MKTVIIRGAGDLASGIIHKLNNSGFKVIACEIDKPTAIRRKVSFSEAVYDCESTVEGLVGKLSTIEEAIAEDGVHVIVDPKLTILKRITPFALVDSILAKRNLGTTMDMSKIVIGVGPGFNAGVDCHAVVETKRGHNLGKIYYSGTAIPNTGIPGEVGGKSADRVLHSPVEGLIDNAVRIGDVVSEGDLIFTVAEEKVYAKFSGVVRGIIRYGFFVSKGMKVADIDPRMDQIENCETISDKARTISGGVLEAILNLGEVI